MDLFFTYGTWWSPPPPAYGNVTIENNVFGHSHMSVRQRRGTTTACRSPIPRPVGQGQPMNGWIVRNNTFESPVISALDGGANGTRWVGNVGSLGLHVRRDVQHNVGATCGGSGKAVSPSRARRRSTAPFGWVNPAAYDFHLTPARRSPSTPAIRPTTRPPTATATPVSARRTPARTSSAARRRRRRRRPRPRRPRRRRHPTPTPTPTARPRRRRRRRRRTRQAPSVPQGMAWTTITQNSIGVRWDASSDNRGVTGYRLYRNGTLAGTTTNTSYSVSGLHVRDELHDRADRDRRGGQRVQPRLRDGHDDHERVQRSGADAHADSVADARRPLRLRRPLRRRRRAPTSSVPGASTRPAARLSTTAAARATRARSRARRARRRASSARRSRSTASMTSCRSPTTPASTCRAA